MWQLLLLLNTMDMLPTEMVSMLDDLDDAASRQNDVVGKLEH